MRRRTSLLRAGGQAMTRRRVQPRPPGRTRPLGSRLDRRMIESLVEQIEARYAEVQAQMSDPEVIGDRQRYADAGRAFTQLSAAAKLAEQYRLAVSDAEGAEELLEEGGEDAELRDELRDARERIERLEEEIRLAMVERD